MGGIPTFAVINPDGSVVTTDGHWCPPCRGFTPKLAEYYKEGLKDKMEIIFVSSDRDEKSFKDYHNEMPWPALPYEKRKEKDLLSKHMGVQGIPTFAVINLDGSVVTTDGRSKVEKDPKGEWLPQPFNDVNDNPSDLNKATWRQRIVRSLGCKGAQPRD